MTVVFVVCAAVGTTVLVLQFLLALVGLGGDMSHDFGHDLGGGDHDFAAGGAEHDFTAGEAHGDASHVGSAHDGPAQAGHEAQTPLQHPSPAPAPIPRSRCSACSRCGRSSRP